MADPLFILKQALKRSRNPWNWCLQRSGVLLLLAALGLQSPLLFATGIIILGASLFELHLPDMQHRLLWKLIRAERDWLDQPWSRRKRVQAGVFIFSGLLLFWSLAVGDVLLLLLVVGGLCLLLVEAAQHQALDWAERDNAERIAAEQAAAERELLERDTEGPQQ